MLIRQMFLLHKDLGPDTAIIYISSNTPNNFSGSRTNSSVMDIMKVILRLSHRAGHQEISVLFPPLPQTSCETF